MTTTCAYAMLEQHLQHDRWCRGVKRAKLTAEDEEANQQKRQQRKSALYSSDDYVLPGAVCIDSTEVIEEHK